MEPNKAANRAQLNARKVSFCWALMAFVGHNLLGRGRLKLDGISFLGYALLYSCLQCL